MPRLSYLLQQGNSDTEPVAVCVRSTGDAPLDGVQKLIERGDKRTANKLVTRVEQVDKGFYRIILVPPDSNTGDYVNVYVDLNKLGLEHVDPGETEEVD